MKKSIWLAAFSLLLSGIFFSGCMKLDDQASFEKEEQQLKEYIVRENIAVSPTATGLYYIPKTVGTGAKPNKCDTISINYTGALLDGTVFDQSEPGKPLTFILGKRQVITGMEEGVLLMKQGGKARLIIPSKLGYGYYQVGNIPPYSTLIFDIEIVSAKTGSIPFNIEGKQVNTTTSGLNYIVVEQDTIGKKAVQGSTVIVQYVAYLQDGTIFDASKLQDKEFTYDIGFDNGIKGWDEGLKLMREGDKFRFIIPPNLAYGEQGVPPVVPANATLTFDVTLVKVMSK